ncbi:acetylxylan esterase [Sphingobacterium paucimobilis]|nr:acetylxylan esterase [Sphingobacterium paucimobilis]
MNLKTVLVAVVLATGLSIAWSPLQAQHNLAGIDVEEPKVVKTDGVEFAVLPDKKDWIYKIGEKPMFKIKLFVDGEPVANANMTYMVGMEKMEPISKGTISLEQGYAELPGEVVSTAGFLRCDVRVRVKDKIYKSVATVAFEPETIKPTVVMPTDFKAFWAEAIAKSKTTPLNTKLTPISDRSTSDVDVYQVEYQFYNDGVKSFFGVLSIPKKEGKYPAIIRFPGAGWAPLGGDPGTAAKGFITLDLYIHGKPVIHDKAFYADLQVNELKDYQYKGIANRDSFYYKNVVLGCVRSVDLVYSLPQFDGKNVGGWGSSQGGALSIITTSLEKRINYMVALCPAMCDFTGYLNNRAGGWPHFFTKPELYKDNQETVMKSLSYFDVVNFAKDISVPAYLSWGFNDVTTPPTTCFAAYNAIQSPKQLYIIPEGEHKIYPAQRTKTYAWLTKNLVK